MDFHNLLFAVFNSLVLLINHSKGNVMKVRNDFHRLAPEKSFDPSRLSIQCMLLHEQTTNFTHILLALQTPLCQLSNKSIHRILFSQRISFKDGSIDPAMLLPPNLHSQQPSRVRDLRAQEAQRCHHYVYILSREVWSSYLPAGSLPTTRGYRSQHEDMSDAVPHYMHLGQENATSANLQYYVLPSKWTQKKTKAVIGRVDAEGSLTRIALSRYSRLRDEVILNSPFNNCTTPDEVHLIGTYLFIAEGL
jgi:hypothetical protein